MKTKEKETEWSIRMCDRCFYICSIEWERHDKLYCHKCSKGKMWYKYDLEQEMKRKPLKFMMRRLFG